MMLSNMDAAFPVPPSSGRPAVSPGLSGAEGDRSRHLNDARLRALAQITGQIYWVTDAQGHLTYASAWCAFTGQTPEEASGDGWVDAVHPDDAGPALADWKAAVATGHAYRGEHRVRRADGSYRLMRAQASPILAADGTVSEWVGVDTDITLLQEFQPDVPASQEAFRATFEQAAVGMAHVGLVDGRLLRVNQKFGDILGVRPEDLLGRSFQELTYPEDLATNLALFEQLLAGTVSTYTLEKRYLRSDGSTIWVHLTATLKRDLAGQPEYGIAVVEDISARKAAEEALRQTEEALRARVQELETIFAALNEGLIVLDEEGRVLRSNPAYEALVGWPAGSALYTVSPQERLRLFQIRDEQGQPIPFDRLLTPRLLQGETTAEEQILRRQDGRDIYVSVRGAPLTDATGRVVGGVLVLHDMTERRQLERQALDLAHQLEAMFAAIADGVAIYDRSGRLVRANPAYHTLLGAPESPDHYALTAEERYRRFQVQDEAGRAISESHRILEELLYGESAGGQGIDLSLQTLDGRNLEVNVTGGPLRDEAGRVTGAVVVYRDVTQRRQLEQQTHQALQALLRMAELLVQHSPEQEAQQGSLLVGRHLAELACSLLGCPVAIILTLDPQTLAMRVRGTIGFTAALEARLHAIISVWKHTPIDLSHIARLMAGVTLVLDDTQPPYQELAELFETRQVIAAPMHIGGQLTGLVIFTPSTRMRTFTDQQIALAGATARLVGLVMERERLWREREEARARAMALQESNRQMDTFLSLVSHELRTPLASLKLSVQLLRRSVEQVLTDQSTVEAGSLYPLLETAERQMHRLERLVKDLLHAARLKEDKLVLRLERLSLGALVEEVVKEQRELTPERTIQVDLPLDRVFMVQADSDRLRQAVTNYLTNALKYSPETAPVGVGIEQEAGQVRVWVRDQGPGIPPAEQERLWERFHRVPGIWEQGSSRGGLGLGLYVTKLLIERQQGRVGMHSTPGQGSTFWFTLPLVQAPAAPEQQGGYGTTGYEI